MLLKSLLLFTTLTLVVSQDIYERLDTRDSLNEDDFGFLESRDSLDNDDLEVRYPSKPNDQVDAHVHNSETTAEGTCQPFKIRGYKIFNCQKADGTTCESRQCGNIAAKANIPCTCISRRFGTGAIKAGALGRQPQQNQFH